MGLDRLCVGCMEEKGHLEVCPLCGYTEPDIEEPSIFLSPRTVLVEKYLIGRVLGQGGFGITYLAWDINLDIKIAVKEFFPQGLVSRGPSSKDVVSFAGDVQKQYEFGLERFLHEAKTLARFADHPNIVTVRDFFRANGTAYMVMNYIEGMTLEAYLEQTGGRLPFIETVNIIMPVLDALKEVHQAGIMHRDISPDNIFIDTVGRIVLIDFGAARQEMRGKSKTLSVILKAGYAPEEQYRTRGEQGPWTDIYAVAATMYRMITGEVPLESMDRLSEDELVLPTDLEADIEPDKEQVLLKAMALKAKDRYRTIEEFQDGLLRRVKTEEVTADKRLSDAQPPVYSVKEDKTPAEKGEIVGSEEIPEHLKGEQPAAGKKKKTTLIAAVITGVILLLIGIYFNNNRIGEESLASTEASIDESAGENVEESAGESSEENIEVNIEEVEVPEYWKEFEGDSFILYLPASWEGGSEEHLDKVIAQLKHYGNQGEVIAQQMEIYKDLYIFFGYDTDTTKQGQVLVNVNLVSEYAIISLQDYMNISYQMMEAEYESMGIEFNIIKQGIKKYGHYENVGKTVLEQTVLGKNIKTAQYIFEDNNTYYIMTFTVDPSRFSQYEDIFDKVAGVLVIGN